MKCYIAKSNPLIFNQAIKHYLESKDSSKPFRFISLWSDEEPYPLSELIEVLNLYLEQLKQQARQDKQNRYSEFIALNYAIDISKGEKELKRLIHIANEKTTQQEQTQ